MEKNIGYVSFLLAAVAGFCDTATFVAGGGVFSAHVTGNFIVFAAQLATGQDAAAYAKLLSFPVFILAVILGGWLIRRALPVLLLESILLLACGIAAGLSGGAAASFIIVMVSVFAMGLQNAYGKAFVKSTYGPTTMMTGNVTQAALDLGVLLRGPAAARAMARESFQGVAFTLGGFLAGCLLGASLSRHFGLVTLIAPGAAMLLCFVAVHRTSGP